MKMLIMLLNLSFLSLTALLAQEKVELFGYFESQMMNSMMKNNSYQLQSNKLRVDLKSALSDKITCTANFNYITYHGKTNWNILEFLPDNITNTIPGDMKSFYMLPFHDRNFLDNANLKIAFKKFDLTAGKQQISLGTGYAWNPIDVFNIKDLLDPTYEQPGHHAIRLDIPLGYRYTFSALYTPEDTWQNSAKLIRFKGQLSHFDYSFIAIEKVWRFHDYSQFDFQYMNFVEIPEKRQLIGVTTAGELFGIGIWAEYGYNNMELTHDFYELVVGADYTFDFQTYMMCEYYRNTLAKTDYQQYTINDWMRLLANEQKAISQDQIFVFIQHPITDLIEIGTSAIYSMTDNSMALVPTLNYNFATNVDMMAYLNFNFGTDGTAFGKNQGQGGFLRARVYF